MSCYTSGDPIVILNYIKTSIEALDGFKQNGEIETFKSPSSSLYLYNETFDGNKTEFKLDRIPKIPHKIEFSINGLVELSGYSINEDTVTWNGYSLDTDDIIKVKYD